MNGGGVTEETVTTQTISGDSQEIEDILKDGLNGNINTHLNGNGINESGAGDTLSMVLDSAAD